MTRNQTAAEGAARTARECNATMKGEKGTAQETENKTKCKDNEDGDDGMELARRGVAHFCVVGRNNFQLLASRLGAH